MYYSKEAVVRFGCGIGSFGLAGVAIWRSIGYVDANWQYPMFASLMIGFWGIMLVITGLGIITQGETNEYWDAPAEQE